MDFSNLDPGFILPVVGGLGLLVVVDTILGSISALQGKAFSWQYTHAFLLTKGAGLVRVATLLVAGLLTPILDFELLGLEANPFTALGLAFAAPLAASLLASIMDNLSGPDATAPQGVAPVNAPVPADKG